MKLGFPSFVVNGVGVGIKFKSSWQTWDLKDEDSTEHIVQWIAKVASGRKDPIVSIVFNCHGGNGYIKMSENAQVRMGDLKLFECLAGKVETIFFRVCQLAAEEGSNVPKSKYNGDVFCRKLAEITKATIVASDDDQSDCSFKTYAVDELDLWEGTVYFYKLGDDGKVSRTSFTGSGRGCSLFDLFT